MCFTGSELRAWLLFYCVPVLEGVLNDEYLEHLCYLVAAFHLLLGDCISGQDLTFANECLVKFYSKAEELYGNQVIILIRLKFTLIFLQAVHSKQ